MRMNTRLTKVLSGVTAALILASPVVSAQGGRGGFRGRRGQGPDADRFLQRMDANGNGKIEASEFQGPEDGFARLDYSLRGGSYAEVFARYTNLDDAAEVGLGMLEAVIIGEYQGVKA